MVRALGKGRFRGVATRRPVAVDEAVPVRPRVDVERGARAERVVGARSRLLDDVDTAGGDGPGYRARPRRPTGKLRTRWFQEQPSQTSTTYAAYSAVPRSSLASSSSEVTHRPLAGSREPNT